MAKKSGGRCQNQKIKSKKAFRSSLKPVVEIAENVREKINNFPKHLQALKRCPFWNFYQPFHEARIDPAHLTRIQKGTEVIMNTFDPVKQVFKFGGGKEFESTAENLALIFGLQRIKSGVFRIIKIPQSQIDDEQSEFRSKYLNGTARMTKEVIKGSLYAAAGDISKPDDFVKLLVLYLCIAVFFPNKTGSALPKRFLDYVFAMDQVSWPDLIHSNFMKALGDTKKPYKEVKGCSVYILYWFAEVTHFISKNEGEPGISKPRFLRWDTCALAEKIVIEGMASLKKDLTGSFIDPLDEGEQSLSTPIKIRQTNSDKIGEKMVRDSDSDGDSESSPDRDAEVLVVHQSKKRKINTEEPHPCEEGNGNCNYEPEHPPSSEPTMPAIPIVTTQESGEKDNENDVLYTSVKDLHGNDVHIGNTSSASEARTTGVVSLEVGELVKEPVDATVDTIYSKCRTPGLTLPPIPTSVDVIPFLTGSTSALAQERVVGFQSMDIFRIPEDNENDTARTSVKNSNGKDIHIGNSSSCSEEETMGIEPLELVEFVNEPMEATSSSNCLTHDPTLLTVSTFLDDTPSLTRCTNASAQEIIEGFEFVGNLKIPEEYKTLYKKIYDKYGHMATRKVIKLNDSILLACVTSLLKIISDMETVRGAELSVALLERWEGFIRDAESLEFNIKWLREGFRRLKNHWKCSFRVDIDIESHEQVLDAKQRKYVGLRTRKAELETELSEVNIEIGKAEAEISSEQEAIQEKQAKNNKFQCEPVVGIVLNEAELLNSSRWLLL